MAKIWIKGYTKPDGTKVKGHYREVSGVSARSNALSKSASATRVKKEAVVMFGKKATKGPRLYPDKGGQTRSSQSDAARSTRRQALRYG
jgi:hypothetical protein